jgi:hypothetical protein
VTLPQGLESPLYIFRLIGEGIPERRRPMADGRAIFIKMCRAEIEDLLEDMGVVEGRLKERFSNSEVTNYVYMENDAVFRIEFATLIGILKLIDAIGVSDYTSVKALWDDLDKKVQNFVDEESAPLLIYEVLSRKLKKIYSYVQDEECLQ